MSGEFNACMEHVMLVGRHHCTVTGFFFHVLLVKKTLPKLKPIYLRAAVQHGIDHYDMSSEN